MSTYGELVWANLMASAGLSAEVIRSQSYDDESFYNIVEKATQVKKPTHLKDLYF